MSNDSVSESGRRIEKGDCSSNVRLYCSPVDEGSKYIQTTYPSTAKTVRERNDVVVIVISCSLLVATQVFCATSIIHGSIDVDDLKEKYPKQHELKCDEIKDKEK